MSLFQCKHKNARKTDIKIIETIKINYTLGGKTLSTDYQDSNYTILKCPDCMCLVYEELK